MSIIEYSVIAISFILMPLSLNLFEAFGQVGNKTFDIAAVGDIGCSKNGNSEEGNKTISSIQNTKPNLVIFLGDLAYKSDLDCFFTQTHNLENNNTRSQVLTVIGNHDIDSGHGNKVTKKELMDHYKIPLTGYYNKTFDNGKILIVGMNFTDLEENDNIAKNILKNDQYAFVKETLENSNATFKIIASHAPFISQDCTTVFRSACHQSLDKWANDTFIKYHKLFKNTGVKLVLSGHNHNYQRAEKEGITYIISGLGGQSKYKISHPGKQMFADVYGFLNLSFNNTTINGKFIDNNGNMNKDIFTIQ
jgi:predicted MPP superfamily phosphohydrolase